MKLSEDEIRAKAVARMIQIDGLLKNERLLAEKNSFLVCSQNGVEIKNFCPTGDYLICRLSRQDLKNGFTPGRWQNILRDIMNFLRSQSEKAD
jgi:hypothetical protein